MGKKKWYCITYRNGNKQGRTIWAATQNEASQQAGGFAKVVAYADRWKEKGI